MSSGFYPVTRVTVRSQRKHIVQVEGEVIPIKQRGECTVFVGSIALQLVG